MVQISQNDRSLLKSLNKPEYFEGMVCTTGFHLGGGGGGRNGVTAPPPLEVVGVKIRNDFPVCG